MHFRSLFPIHNLLRASEYQDKVSLGSLFILGSLLFARKYMEEGQEQSDFARLIIEKPQLLNERNPTNQSAERKVAKGWFPRQIL